ncbi:MAG: toll/interleukin-1 receptor domain-containing protein [Anaerolineales bacterium]|nr:toll/interleukin-1 receptor domain-containing protein [Anaerolineales bacterium]
MTAQIFLSYSHSDAAFAAKLAGGLEKAGYEVWLDRTDIQTGARWDDEIVKGLDASAVFLVLLSEASTASQNVKDEIGYALDHNKQILPLLIESCEIPFRLRRVQYVDFAALKYSEGLQTVLSIVKSFTTNGKKTNTSSPVATAKKREEKNMPGKKSGTSKNAGGDKFTISITGNSNVAAIGRGARATVNQGGGLDAEMEAWRKQMEKKISGLQNLYPEDKSALNQQVEQIAREVEKGAQADASRVERLVNTIAAMAPDIFEVAVATLVNPLAGVGLVAKKIGDKAQVRKA